MSQTLICGDPGALVAYLYDECDADERRAIGAHVLVCDGCAEELASLGATRTQLAAWRPPDAQLGFRVVSEAPFRRSRWWKQPLPAWAQAAAAALIFGAGVTLGALRGTAPRAATESQARSAQARTAQTNTVQVNTAAPVAASVAAVSQKDLSALEQRLRADMSQTRNTSGPVAAGTDDAQLLERVRAMIQDSEQRQQRELALRTAEVVRDFDAQRRVDLARIERTLGQMDGTTGVEVEQQRQMLNYLMRVSQRGQ